MTGRRRVRVRARAFARHVPGTVAPPCIRQTKRLARSSSNSTAKDALQSFFRPAAVGSKGDARRFLQALAWLLARRATQPTARVRLIADHRGFCRRRQHNSHRLPEAHRVPRGERQRARPIAAVAARRSPSRRRSPRIHWPPDSPRCCRCGRPVRWRFLSRRARNLAARRRLEIIAPTHAGGNHPVAQATRRRPPSC